MCGIVGYVGPRDATPLILNGLQRLEYRGYDSAGLAVLQNGNLAIRRDVGKLNNLMRLVHDEPLNGRIGIGHTRWATHGVPSPRNAHPHISVNGRTVVVHNGIVENFRQLRDQLQHEGVPFASETDTEVIVHLIARSRMETPDAQVLDALSRLEGSYSLILTVGETMYAARDPHGVRPLALGRLDPGEKALQLVVLAHFRRNVIERPGKVVRHGEDVAREPGRGIGARVLDVLLQAPAHVLHLGLGVEHFLLRLLEVAPQRVQRIVERAFAGFGAVLVEQFLGHARKLLLDRFVAQSLSGIFGIVHRVPGSFSQFVCPAIGP